MGKALILSSLGDGHYSIKVFFDNARVEAKKTAIQDLLTQIDQSLEDLAPAKTQAQQNLYVAWLNLNNAITNNLSYGELADAQQSALTARRDLDRVIAREKQLNLLKTSSEKEIVALEQYAPAEIETTAWCVSRNEDLTGETKTIEIDYVVERDPITNQIRSNTGFWIPASEEQANPPAPTNILQHQLASSEYATWFNLCILPAMQRDQGLYRIASLTSVDKENNLCNITFEGRYTVDQSRSSLIDEPTHPVVDGGQQQTATDIVIYYPPCHAKAFEIGDRVIVDLSLLRVIGFYSNPRKCRKVVSSRGFSALGFAMPPFIANEGAVATHNRDYMFNLIYHIVQSSPESQPVLVPDGGTDYETIEEANVGLTTTYGDRVGKTNFDYVYTFYNDYHVTRSSSYSIDYSSGNAFYTGSGSLTEVRTQKLTVELFINGSSQGTVYDAQFTDTWVGDSSSIGSHYIDDKTFTREFTAFIRQLYVYDDEDIIKGEVTRNAHSSRIINYGVVDGEFNVVLDDTQNYTITTQKSGDMNDVDVDGEGTVTGDVFVAVAFGSGIFTEAPVEREYVLGQRVNEHRNWTGTLQIKND